jgi:tRNA wybutosine-synthesizing protein 1
MGLLGWVKKTFGGGDGASTSNAAATSDGTGAPPSKPDAPKPSATPSVTTTKAADADAPGVGEAATMGKIFFGSQTGTARRLAHKLAASLRTRHGLVLEVTDMKAYDPDDLVHEPVALVLLSTYEGGPDGGAVPPEAAQYFCQWSRESAQDERFGMLYLKDTKFAVFGCGNREYGPDRFNAAARALDADLARLGGNRLLRRADGDESSGRMEDQFHEWADKLAERLNPTPSNVDDNNNTAAAGGAKGGGAKGGAKHAGTKDRTKVVVGGKTVAVRAAGKWVGDGAKSVADVTQEAEAEIQANGGVVAYDTDAEEGSSDGGSDDEDEEGGGDEEGEMSAGSEDDMDMEDIGADGNPTNPKEKREMVTPQLREALTKQGYKILGSHSGVKLCRWTKAMLRGRGGCYKHTFYGIESHRCMEATPSLACANKCVFCWRHHTNPVGREWRWQMDDPLELVESAVSEHRGMIKQMKGVPGVQPARFEEGMDPRHCALSLVGEPIMYPEIGKFVNALHGRRISTFLVTNAQFPDAIRDLPAITQLYVSVDAATPETLKAIDRPLFGDFWVRVVCSPGGVAVGLEEKKRLFLFFVNHFSSSCLHTLCRRRGMLFVCLFVCYVFLFFFGASCQNSDRSLR